MQMLNHLARIRTAVGDQPKTLIQYVLLLSDLLRSTMKLADHVHRLIGERRNSFYMLFWDDEDVNGSLRVDIPKRHHMLIFKHHVGLHLTGGDPTKNTIVH